MAKFEFTGMDEYIRQLERIGMQSATADVCKAAVYDGAAVVANAIKDELNGLKTVEGKEAIKAWQKQEPTFLTERQKDGLVKSFGVTSIRERMGVYDTKLGFDGYNDVETRRWPDGQPNALVARSCNSGSTSMLKQPFIRRAFDRVKSRVIPRMAAAADEKITKIMGGNENG